MLLYGRMGSPFVRRTAILLDRLGIGFEIEPIAAIADQTELRRTSPVGRVPALRIGDRVLVDSLAIALTLLEEHDPEGAHFPRHGPELAEAHQRQYEQDREAAEKLLATGIRPRNAELDTAELAAWTSIDGLRDPTRFRSWLYGLGWRLAASRFRSEDRRKAREEAYSAEQVGAPGLSPEDRMALESAMSQLPPDQRAAVALCLSGGFSHTEAAEALGLPIGTVKSHVTRGRAKLLEALGETP